MRIWNAPGCPDWDCDSRRVWAGKEGLLPREDLPPEIGIWHTFRDGLDDHEGMLQVWLES